MRIVLFSYNLATAERTIILAALQGSFDGLAGAAEALGVSLKRLEYLMQLHDVQAPPMRPSTRRGRRGQRAKPTED